MTMIAEANPLAAVRTILKRDPNIAALTEGRIYIPEFDGKDPRGNAQAMIRPCAVIRNTGGGSLGPGARSRAPWAVTRLDVESFGKTAYESSRVHWMIYRVLVALERTTVNDTILIDAVVTGGPINEVDSDTGWPFTLGVYDLSSAYDIPEPKPQGLA